MKSCDDMDRYEFVEVGLGLPSSMGVVPANGDFSFEKKEIKERLANATGFELASFNDSDDLSEDFALSSCAAGIKYQGEEPFDITINLISTENLDLQNYGFGNLIDKDSMEKAANQKYYIETTMHFGDSILNSFLLQLKVMDAIVPEASVVIDFMPYRLLSGKWLKMTAKSEIPPSPDYLFSIHSIYDELNDGTKQYWFHTHGLHRCRMPELEMVNISDGAQQMYTMLSTVVKKSLADCAKERERFAIGYDGMELNMCWLRWEEALKDFPPNMLGGLNDRGDGKEYNIHAEPSGILFAVEESNMLSPQIYAKTLADNPIYYFTTEETNRMRSLAKERFHLFKAVFDKMKSEKKNAGFLGKLFKKKENMAEKYNFLVKIGLLVDNYEDDTQREHLWFDVMDITDNKVYAKLINQPYWISGLNKGDEAFYDLELLTDWSIHTEDNSYTPDSIYLL